MEAFVPPDAPRLPIASCGQPKSFRAAAACRRLLVARDHEGRARQIAQRGSRIVKWETNLNLGLTHHSFGLKLARRSRAPRTSRSKRRILRFAAGYDNVAGPRASEATLREESRRRDPRLSPDPLFCAGRCWLLPSSNVLPCAVHVLPSWTIVFGKAEKEGPPSGPRLVCIGRIFDAMDRNFSKIKAEPE